MNRDCFNCEDTGYIVATINGKEVEIKCSMCSTPWKNKSIKKYYPKPSVINYYDRKGTCMVDTGDVYDKNNTWHILFKWPTQVNTLYNLKDLAKYSNVKEEDCKTNITYKELFVAILTTLDFTTPIEEKNTPEDCGYFEFRSPNYEVRTFKALADQLGFPFKLENFHKKKNCPALKDLGV
jgi:hypothetical protein